MECGGRLASTVRTAATSAWPMTWPPNTRCQPACGERAEQVQIELFEIEDCEQIFNGGRHLKQACKGSKFGLNLLCSGAIYKEDAWPISSAMW